MSNGQIIGRVAVKVVPDTTDFRDEAKVKLEKIENRLPKVKVQAKFDETGLKTEILKAVRSINQDLRSNDAYKVKLRATISNVGMKGAIRDAVRELNALASGERIKFRTDVAAALIEGELDNASMEHVKKQLEDWRDDNSPLTIDIAPTMLAGASAYVSGRLAALTRPRTVEIIPVMEPGAASAVATALAALSGARVLNDMLDGLWERLKRLDKSVPIIGTMAEAIAGLGAYGMTAASNLFALSSSLAQIGGAAFALPGIFGGIAIGLGASIAVLKDFTTVIPEVKQHLATLQDQMSKNFWGVAEQPIRKLIDTLLPQFSSGLRQTSTELGGFFGNLATSFEGVFNGALDGMFTDLSDSISIFSEHTGALASIIKILGETGAGYLPQLATWVGELLEKFNNFLTAAQADGSLKGWIDTGIFQLQELGRALGNLGGIFHGLADIAEASGGSTLTMFADTLQAVEDTVKGSTFKSTMIEAFTAAHEAMSTIADIAGPSVENLFLTLGQTAARVFPIMGTTIGTAFKAIADALSQPAVANGVVKMFQGLQTAVQGLAPAMAPVGKALGSVFTLIGAMASQMGPTIGAALGIIAPIFSKVAQAAIPLVNMLGPMLRGAISALAPVFALLGENLVKIVGAAQPLIAKIGELVALVAPVLIPALKFLVTMIGGAILGVIGGLVQALSGVIGVIKGVVGILQGAFNLVVGLFTGNGEKIKQGWSQLWNGIKTFAVGIFNAIVGAIRVWLSGSILGVFRGGIMKLVTAWKGGWTGIKSLVTSVWNGIKSFISTVWNAIKAGFTTNLNNIKLLWGAVWTGIKQAFTRVWGEIKSFGSNIMAGIKGAISGFVNGVRTIWQAGWQAVKAVVTTIWQGIKSAVSTGVSNMMAVVRGIPSKIKGVFSGAISWLSQTGRDIVQGLINGIGDMASALLDKIGGLASSAIGKLKSVFKTRSPSKVTTQIGKWVGQGLVKGIDGTSGSVEKVFDNLLVLVNKSGNKRLKQLVNTTRQRLTEMVNVFEQAQADVERQQEKLDAKLDEMHSYAERVRDTFRELGNVTQFSGGEDEEGNKLPLTFAKITESMQEAIKKAREYKTALKSLMDMGLNKTTLDQLVQAGPDAGLEAAKLIAEQGQAGVDVINEMADTLNDLGVKVGDKTSEYMFQVGVNTAQGVLDGLISKRDEIAAEMRRIGQEMVNTIKQELGIKSPSRVFKALGGYVSEGFALGISANAGQVDKALAGMTGIRAAGLSSQIDAALSDSSSGGTTEKHLHYYAAPGSSLGSEEDLFAAAGRARMVGW